MTALAGRLQTRWTLTQVQGRCHHPCSIASVVARCVVTGERLDLQSLYGEISLFSAVAVICVYARFGDFRTLSPRVYTIGSENPGSGRRTTSTRGCRSESTRCVAGDVIMSVRVIC